MAHVRATGQLLRVCEECEALWPEAGAITKTNFEDMTAYLRLLGLKGEWKELEIQNE